MTGYVIVGLNYCRLRICRSIHGPILSVSRALVLSLAFPFSLPFSLFFNLYLILYWTRTSLRTRDRLRSYCFWIPRLLWEHPIGTISCKYQSYSEWGGMGGEGCRIAWIGESFVCWVSFTDNTITIRTISISICVIGKVKVHLISHTFWECRGRFYSLSKQRGRFCQKHLLASPSFFTCTFLMDLISWYIFSSLCGKTHICKKTNWNNDEKHAVTFLIQKLFYNLDDKLYEISLHNCRNM